MSSVLDGSKEGAIELVNNVGKIKIDLRQTSSGVKVGRNEVGEDEASNGSNQ